MNLLKSTPLLAFVVLASLSHAQDKKTLRFNVKPGSVITHTSVTDGKFALTGPADQEFKNKSTMVQEYKFDAGTDGYSKFTATTTDFKMEGDQMDMGGGPSPDEMIAAIKKVKLMGEVNGLGLTRNVSLAGDDGLDMMSKQMMTSIADQMSQIGFFSVSMPEEAVGVGSTWKKNYDFAKSLSAIPFFKEVKGATPVEFTLEAFETVDGKETAKIKTFMDGKATFELAMGGSGSGSMTTTSKGYVWIDLATGLPLKTDTKLANLIDFGMGNMQQEMSIKSTIVVKG